MKSQLCVCVSLLLLLLPMLLQATVTDHTGMHGNLRSNTTAMTERHLSTPSNDNNERDILAEFKNRNLLKDNFLKTPIQLQGNYLTFGGSTTLNLSPASLQALPFVFATHAHYYLDGIKQASLPPNVLYSPKDDSNVWLVMNQGAMETAIRVNPNNGKTTVLMPMELDLLVFSEVDTNDIDPDKLSRYKFSEDNHNTRSLQELLLLAEERQQWQFDKPNPPPPCTSYQVLQVAIAYESRFCETMGGSQRANQVVQLTVAQASLKFERSGLCTKLQLSHLEGYCDPKKDPYHHFFAGSVCTPGDSTSTLALFRNYWLTNRSNVVRDVAHLFHGFNHASGTVGCAWAGSLCDHEFGYGVNELTFGGNNNPTFWTKLFAHELGHSAGAPHTAASSESLMNARMCLECEEFSDTSVAYIKLLLASVDCLQDEHVPGSGGLDPPGSNSGNDNTIADTPDGGGSSSNNEWGQGGTCSNRLGYCNLGPCCAGYTCYNRFICL